MSFPRPLLPALLAATLLLSAGCQRSPESDPRMVAPTTLADAVTQAGAKHVYWNPTARQVLAASGRDVGASRPEDFAALADPALWRKLDRRDRFDAVALAGQPSEYAALLVHLLASPDFRLVHLDNWGVLFVRGRPETFTPPVVTAAAADLEDPIERARYLAQMAVVLDAAGEAGAARKYLQTALTLAPKESIVRTRAAYLALQNLHFRDAIAAADEAIALDSGNGPAFQIKAQALAASGQLDAAWVAAEHFKELASPTDMNALFLHAQLANAAHAYSREQDSLERLVALAEKAGIPTANYRVYLGQCYAKQGRAELALAQLEAALAEPGLSATQRTDVETAVKTITARSGMTPAP